MTILMCRQQSLSIYDYAMEDIYEIILHSQVKGDRCEHDGRYEHWHKRCLCLNLTEAVMNIPKFGKRSEHCDHGGQNNQKQK